MKYIGLWFVLLLSGCSGCSQTAGNSTVRGVTGSPVLLPTISGITSVETATTIAANFTTASSAVVSMACGTTLGSYTETSVDSEVFISATANQQIVAGLLASTLYYCQISATNPAGTTISNFTATTSATSATTAIASLNFGTPTSVGSGSTADTFFNATASNGVNYFSNDDTIGWTNGGGSGCGSQNGMTVGKFTNLSPVQGMVVNCLSSYGTSSGTPPDSRSAKNGGMFAMSGMLILSTGKECNSGPSGCTQASYPHDAGQVISSPDFGATWNNFQNPSSFSASGNPTSPTNATMFAGTPSNFGSATFVMYGPDDGTLGYLNSYTQQDNANAYVYLVSNEGYWNGGGAGNLGSGGNDYYLARVARAKLSRLLPSDYQFFTGGDGSLDANWSATESNAVAILSNTGELSELAINYIPTLNRYLMLTYYYPQGVSTNSANTSWLGYEAPHPWGPWTLVYTTNWPTQGYYQEIPILSSGVLTGTTMTVIFTNNFQATYQPYTASLTVN